MKIIAFIEQEVEIAARVRQKSLERSRVEAARVRAFSGCHWLEPPADPLPRSLDQRLDLPCHRGIGTILARPAQSSGNRVQGVTSQRNSHRQGGGGGVVAVHRHRYR